MAQRRHPPPGRPVGARARFLVVLLGVVLGVHLGVHLGVGPVACVGEPPPAAPDGGVCPADLPPPSDTCLEGQCGNELGVGRPCTRGGNECSDLNLFAGEAGICIADFADNTNVFCCSRVCDDDSECGSGAVCATNPANPLAKGCVPRGCEGR